jgi:hypothetical protein
MKKTLKIAVSVVFLVLMTLVTYAQEWTSDQKEVWTVVNDSWAKFKTGDVDGMAAVIHPKYQGWTDSDPLPTDKEHMVAWYNKMKSMMQVDDYSLNPARIVVVKNSALVDYYFNLSTTYTWEGEQVSKQIKGKNVEFYVKEDGKWMLLGDMTVFLDEEEDDD